jgi:hypothetical protein
MYRLFNCFILAVFYALLFGCDGGPASNYPQQSAGTSSSPATAKMPSSLPAGTRISFNPEITLNVEVSAGSSGQATYTNNSGSSDFGIGEEEILVHLKLTPASLIITYTLKNNEQVELVLTNFIDMGDDGYFDEFTVNATVNRNFKFSYVGHFRGLKKPRNLAVSQTFNTNRAPTEDEFNKYLLGKSLYGFNLSENGADVDMGRLVLHPNGKFLQYITEDGDQKYVDGFSWEYNYNGGSPVFIVTIEKPSSDSEIEKRVIEANLDFTNFYEATFKVSSDLTNGQSNANNYEGIWIALTGIPTILP